MAEVIIQDEESSLLAKCLSKLRSEIGEIPEAYLSHESFAFHDVLRFDVNRFLEVFDRIRVEDGYMLDYVYSNDVWSGEPLLYARKITSRPLSSEEEYCRLFPDAKRAGLGRIDSGGYLPFLNSVEFEKSASGFFQFAVFYHAVRQFYLYWHACYNDLMFIFTHSQLEQLFDSIAATQLRGMPIEN
ncbi:MAG: hypothetical protein J7K94_02855 [Dehalococcoidia bacterium]|nr:hypothetical protein [Dehalococcoidia bacterium]